MADKPILLTASAPSAFRHMDIFRNPVTGAMAWVIPRRSGRLRVYPLTKMLPRGCPFERVLSEENQERLEAARDAVYGYED